MDVGGLCGGSSSGGLEDGAVAVADAGKCGGVVGRGRSDGAGGCAGTSGRSRSKSSQAGICCGSVRYARAPRH
eukprot:1183153-Rhodomonas_salina.1